MTEPIPKPRDGNGDLSKIKIVLTVIAILVGALLPGIGYVASSVIDNRETGAVLTKLLERHILQPIHTGAATSREVGAIVASLEKQHEIRDANLRRELVEIKEALRELRNKK